MSLTKVSVGAINQMMCMDGTAAIKDAIHNVAFTMAGAPTTGALLGATAPDIAAGKYTSCTMPTAGLGLTPGGDFTLMCVLQTTWAGGAGTSCVAFIANNTSPDRFRLICVTDTWIFYAGNKTASIAINAGNWAAGVPHVLICTAQSGTLRIWLDGVEGTPATGTTREVSFGVTTYVGAGIAGAAPIEGLELAALYGKILTPWTPATWASVIDLPQITVTGLSTGNAVRLYDAAGNIHASAVEAGGTATLTYTLD